MPAPDIHAVIWDFGGVISSSLPCSTCHCATRA